MIPINNKKLKEKSFNPIKYRQAVVNLLYLAICTSVQGQTFYF